MQEAGLRFEFCYFPNTRMVSILTLMLDGKSIEVHPIEKRLARWLLVTQDRVGTHVLPLTHEFLSQMFRSEPFYGLNPCSRNARNRLDRISTGEGAYPREAETGEGELRMLPNNEQATEDLGRGVCREPSLIRFHYGKIVAVVAS